ncbi:MAG: hypothetical protein OES57_09315, partial [Acidimicrobiia bacterium]|nr:hypothetical protein [Acidimicrobiia bacterium]
DHRLVTLLGVGGVGKTRLAIEVAGRLADEFPGGVRFCELAPVADGAAVVDAVAEAVGARPQPGMDLASSIADFVGGRDMLLVLDNCEHVIEASRRLVTSLLGVEGVSVLATSRESIDVPAEQTWHVEPFVDAEHGVQLFVDRALERDADFTLDADTEPHIREICRRLDDIPLAIELAAARVRVLSPEQLAQRLDDRFSLLKGRRHGDRQQTLRDTVQWSYDLLEPEERRLFGRLSVFAGSFSLTSVEAVCITDEADELEVVEHLDALVDKSMIVSRGVGGRVRFSMLETLRQFAAQQLDDDAAADIVRRGHEDHFCEVAARQNAALFGSREDDAWQRFADEWDNLRAAYESARDRGELDRAADLIISVAWFAVLSIRNEAFGWAQELLQVDSVDRIAHYPSLCGVAGMGAYLTVDPAAEQLAEQGLALDQRDPHGFCRSTLCAVYLNNLHKAEASDRVTAEWLTHLDGTHVGNQLWAHGFRAFHVASYRWRAGVDEAAYHADQVMDLADQTGSTSALALAHWAAGLALSVDDLPGALERLQLGLSTASSLSSEHLLGHLIVGLQLHFGARRGDLVEMLELCRMAVSDALDQHYFTGASHALGVSAIVITRAGDAHTAGRLLGAMVANGHIPRDNARHMVSQALGDDYDAVTASGAGLSAQEAGRLAIQAIDRALSGVGSVS